MTSIQYTVRGVPPELDKQLRREAHETGKSLNAVVIDALEQAKLPARRVHHDLDWFIGSAPADAYHGMDEALEWMDSMPTGLE